jgi:hypothetical protein
VQIDNRNGSITIGVPDKVGFKVEARSRGGEVRADFPEIKPKNDGTATGSVGNGAIRMVLNNEHGNIYLRRE